MIFNWFRASCPLGLREQLWVERRMNWIVQQFGEDRIRSAIDILPTAKNFPAGIPSDRESTQALLTRLCEYLNIDPSSIELQFFEGDVDEEAGVGQPMIQSHVCGTYSTHPTKNKMGLIRLSSRELKAKDGIVATLAHELCHHLLDGAGRLSHEWDGEMVTDLLAIMLGFGVQLANNSVYQQSNR